MLSNCVSPLLLLLNYCILDVKKNIILALYTGQQATCTLNIGIRSENPVDHDLESIDPLFSDLLFRLNF